MKRFILILLLSSFLFNYLTQAQELRKGLIAFWEFDEIQQSISPDAFSLHHGQVNGASLNIESSAIKNYHFYGKTSYVKFPELIIKNQFSVSTWAKRINDPGYSRPIISSYDEETGAGFGIYFGYRQQYFRVIIKDESGNEKNYRSHNSLRQYSWFHLCFTFDKGDLKLFLDGKEIDLVKVSDGDLSGDIDFSSTIFIGTTYMLKNFLNGYVDNTAIWNRVLDKKEIKKLYAYKQSSPKDLVEPLIAGKLTASQSIDFNAIPGKLSVADTEGGNGEYSYYWLASNNKENWKSVGSDSPAFQPGHLTQTTYYKVIVSSRKQMNLTNTIKVEVEFPHALPKEKNSEEIKFEVVPTVYVKDLTWYIKSRETLNDITIEVIDKDSNKCIFLKNYDQVQRGVKHKIELNNNIGGSLLFKIKGNKVLKFRT